MKRFVSKNKKWFGYTAYVVVVAAILLYVRFPAVEAMAYLERSMEQASSDLSLTVERVSLHYPPGFMFSGPRLSTKQNPAAVLLGADSLLVSGNPWKILRGDHRVRLACDAYGGSINGEVLVTAIDAFSFDADLVLQDIELARHELLVALIPGMELKAGLGGTIEYQGNLEAMRDGTGKAALKVGGGQIRVVEPIFGFQGDVDFHEVQIESSLKERKLLVRANLIGKDIDAEVSGTIHLEQRFADSKLTLKGNLAPSDNFLNKVSAGFLDSKIMKKGLQGGEISFVVQGTVESPKLKFF